MKGQEQYIEKHFIEFNNNLSYLKDKFMALFTAHGSEYIIPLSHNNHLVAIIFMSGRTENKRLKEREFMFLNRISRYAAVALANSIMYQNLADLTDNLEKKLRKEQPLLNPRKRNWKRIFNLQKQYRQYFFRRKFPALRRWILHTSMYP
jgi:transcriptional regulator with GAF, ATPase, and Fis domain